MNCKIMQGGVLLKRAVKSLFLVFVLMISLTSVSNASVSVTSDSKYFDILSGCFVLQGNVLVQTDDRSISADSAKVNLTSREVWADGNIHLEQPADNIEFDGGSLYATDANKTAQIKGNVLFKRPDITIQANTCSFNWDTKVAEFDGLVDVTRDGKVSSYNTVIYNVEDNKIISAE